MFIISYVISMYAYILIIFYVYVLAIFQTFNVFI